MSAFLRAVQADEFSKNGSVTNDRVFLRLLIIGVLWILILGACFQYLLCNRFSSYVNFVAKYYHSSTALLLEKFSYSFIYSFNPKSLALKNYSVFRSVMIFFCF